MHLVARSFAPVEVNVESAELVKYDNSGMPNSRQTNEPDCE